MADQFNILDYTYGPGLKTGQIIDRTPAGYTTKDDGGFQKGIAGSKADEQYIILTTGQYSGNTNITVNAIIDTHTNACVFDKVTGLMWNREPSPAIYGTGTEDLLWDDTAGSNEDIFNYCDQANANNLSGFSDWRVPNLIEICSLILYDSSNGPPTINLTAFPAWKFGAFHSSTTQINNSGKSLSANFTAGTTAGISKTTIRDVCALVRLGP